MKDDRPSLTAGLVAWARGVASIRPLVQPALHDEAAQRLLPGLVSWTIPAPERPWTWATQQALRALSVGLVDHLALRTTAIDAALAEALSGGVRQVVLLGAGLDARAYRIAGLEEATVYEVDHPSTQRFKQDRCGELEVRARKLVYVSVDFARDSLDRALELAGHDKGAPTFWIWEGVTMYLPPEATRGTLEVVAVRSAPGSRIAVTYLSPVLSQLPLPLRAAVAASFRILGEPLLGEMSPEEATALLNRVGFKILSDEHSVDWERRFGGSSLAAIAYRMERLAVAEKLPRSMA